MKLNIIPLIKSYVNDRKRFDIITTVKRLKGVYIYEGSRYVHVDVTAKDEAIIADVIINRRLDTYAVRATYRIPPFSTPFIFYVGNNMDDVQAALERVFKLTLEDVLKLSLNTDWNFPMCGEDE